MVDTDTLLHDSICHVDDFCQQCLAPEHRPAGRPVLARSWRSLTAACSMCFASITSVLTPWRVFRFA